MARQKTRRGMSVVRHRRLRQALRGSAGRPRLAVFRSGRHIYAQVIDDTAARTLAAASSLQKDLAKQTAKKKPTEVAQIVGQAVAEKAKAVGVTEVVFDRGGFKYHGRVKALADGAREAGLEF